MKAATFITVERVQPMPRTHHHRLIRSAVTALLVGSLAGCGILSGAGPYRATIALEEGDTDPRYEVIDLTAQTIRSYQRAPVAELTSDVSQLRVSNVYLIPGDVIGVMISDSAQEGALFTPLNAGGTVFPKVRVDAAGQISLPYVGDIKVSGMTLTQVETAIQKRLKGKAM